MFGSFQMPVLKHLKGQMFLHPTPFMSGLTELAQRCMKTAHFKTNWHQQLCHLMVLYLRQQMTISFRSTQRECLIKGEREREISCLFLFERERAQTRSALLGAGSSFSSGGHSRQRISGPQGRGPMLPASSGTLLFRSPSSGLLLSSRLL